MRSTFSLTFVLVLWAIPAYAQTPEQAVVTYLDQIKTHGLGSTGTLLHPDELRKFHEMMQPIVEEALLSDEGRTMFQPFADPNYHTRMLALSDADFLNVFLQILEIHQPGFSDMFKALNAQALGHVVEGDVKHVVVRLRIKYQGIEMERMSVISVKDHLGQPKMMLTGEINGLAEALRRQR